MVVRISLLLIYKLTLIIGVYMGRLGAAHRFSTHWGSWNICPGIRKG
jgi:hypothetical protein